MISILKNTETRQAIEIFLKSLNVENIDIPYMVNIDNIDIENAYQSIYDMIEDNSGFNIDIIYYSKAMKYLSDNDNSLNQSMLIAQDLGYDPKNINSELLASLLASENAREEFSELEGEINTFFEELQAKFEESQEQEEEEL